MAELKIPKKIGEFKGYPKAGRKKLIANITVTSAHHETQSPCISRIRARISGPLEECRIKKRWWWCAWHGHHSGQRPKRKKKKKKRASK